MEALQWSIRHVKEIWANSNFRFFWEKKIRFLKKKFSKNRNFFFKKNRKFELGQKSFIGRLDHQKTPKSQICRFLAHWTWETKKKQEIVDLEVCQCSNRRNKMFWTNSNFPFFEKKRFRFLKFFFSENRKIFFKKNRKLSWIKKSFIGRLGHRKTRKPPISRFFGLLNPIRHGKILYV